MNQRIIFSDKSDGVWFEYCPTPKKPLAIGKKGGRLNISALSLYSMYRTTVFDSYKVNPGLSEDIKSFKKEYEEKPSSALLKDGVYNNPVHHYSVAASIGAMREWLDPSEKMQFYLAYKNIEGRKKVVGFVHFNEKNLDGNPVVYIAQAGVATRSAGVGRRLMECVLSHYPEGTHFKVLTREFNDQAKGLYESLKFSPINPGDIVKLGYDSRYCGFEHTVQKQELEAIKRKQVMFDEPISVLCAP